MFSAILSSSLQTRTLTSSSAPISRYGDLTLSTELFNPLHAVIQIDVSQRVEVSGRSQWAELEQEEEEEEAFEETDSGDMSDDDSESGDS